MVAILFIYEIIKTNNFVSSKVRMLASVVLIGSALLCSNVVLGSQNANPEFVQLRMARPRTISETPVHQG